MMRKNREKDISTKRSNRSCTRRNSTTYKKRMEMTEKNTACGNLNAVQDENNLRNNNSLNECNLQSITTESSDRIVEADQKELQAVVEILQSSTAESSGVLENILLKETTNEREVLGQEKVKIDSNQYIPTNKEIDKDLKSSKETEECEKSFELERTMAESSDEKLENSLLEDELEIEKENNSKEDLFSKCDENNNSLTEGEMVSKMEVEKVDNSKEELSSKCNENDQKEDNSKEELSSKCNENSYSLAEDESVSKMEVEKEDISKEELSSECNENSNSLTEDEMVSKMEIEKENGSKEHLSSKCDENSQPVKKEISKRVNSLHVSKANEFANYFDIKIPLIGKPMKMNNSKPLGKRYDLAMEINRRRAAYNKKMGYDKFIPQQRPWEMKAKTEEEKVEEDAKKLEITVGIARYISRICLRILNELNKETYDENKVVKHFEKFLIGPATPTALLYVPHFVNFIMWCRKNKEFSLRIRSLATKAYDRCRVMFPVPCGYNFITVYMQQVKNFVPDDFETLESSIPLIHCTNNIPNCDGKNDADKMLDEELNIRNL